MFIPVIAFFLAVAHLRVALALPFWQNTVSFNRNDPLIPGATHLEALALKRRMIPNMPTSFISVNTPNGTPGNAVVRLGDAPPIFYIHQGQLWQYHNQTYIFPVNLVNSTQSASLPFQLVTGDKKAGVSGGGWSWQGTMLYYQLGEKSNQGVYYSCRDSSGSEGVFTSLDSTLDPVGCEKMTIRSFVRSSLVEQ